jgi:cytidylate kinase
MKNRHKVTVAIDGPAGAGKSTVAREVAQALGFALVDTGAIYRSVALLAKQRQVAWDDDAGLLPIVSNLQIAFSLEGGENRVRLGTQDVTSSIRTSEISRGASIVSRSGLVRSGLLELQRRLAGAGAAVLEGRDIGTVVCPEARVKFFLHATDEVRAQRRFDELQARGEQALYPEVLQELRERDALDRERLLSPLRPADDATMLDSTTLPVQEVIDIIVAAAHRAANSG